MEGGVGGGGSGRDEVEGRWKDRGEREDERTDLSRTLPLDR